MCGSGSATTQEAAFGGATNTDNPVPPAPEPPSLGTSSAPSGSTTTSGSSGSDFGDGSRACPPSKFDIKFKDVSLGVTTGNSWIGWVALVSALAGFFVVLWAALFLAKNATGGIPWSLLMLGALLTALLGGAVGWLVKGGSEQQQMVARLNEAKLVVDQQIGDRLASCEARNLQLEATQEAMRSIWPVLAQRTGAALNPVADRGQSSQVAAAGTDEDVRSAPMDVVLLVFVAILLTAVLLGIGVLGWTEHARRRAVGEVRDLLRAESDNRATPSTFPEPAATPPAPIGDRQS